MRGTEARLCSAGASDLRGRILHGRLVLDRRSAVAAHDVTITLRGVDRTGLAKRYTSPKPAHDIVLSHLLERVDAYAAKEQQLALVIADKVDNPARHRADLTRYRTDGTGGYRSRQITRIVDTLHFAPSHSSRLVQAVDLVTFLHRRLMTVTESDRRAAAVNERMWSWVQPRVYHAWCWNPARQTHKGPA
ncbi:DUF3800 domain-containing protein [Solwaraspora sp. WMMD406]|uniref:DUF3800 domain-containing protein n=1 Tax=Solwaraspora sp. WMMD406 TaxID=3016095 RepID=UPI002416EC6C|nr:DUF3800 domain-containing protein [Solwaraspora sp. WMMD406]MDG4763701.1 DUF3800 domain-containing protein [Solwaraspora sp. WMMD406]